MGPEKLLTLPLVNFVPILAGNLLDLLCGGFRQGSSDSVIGISSIPWVVFQGKIVYSANTKFFLYSENISICMTNIIYMYVELGEALNHTIIASKRAWGGLSPYCEPPGGSSEFLSMMSRFPLGL